MPGTVILTFTSNRFHWDGKNQSYRWNLEVLNFVKGYVIKDPHIENISFKGRVASENLQSIK